MGKRRKRQPPVANQAPAVPATEAIDLDWVADHKRVMDRAFTKGNARSPQTAIDQDAIVARFARWGYVKNITLTDYLVDGGRGRMYLDAWVVVAFLIELARPGYITPRTWLGYRSTLLSGLKHLDVPVLVPDLDVEFLQRVSAQLDATDPRPAAPVFMGYGLEEIRDALATEPDELWRAALVADHLVAHWFGGRCTETTVNVRWKHIDIDDEHMTVTWPPSKYQTEPKSVRVKVADLPDNINPAIAVAKLRAASAKAGLDTSSDDRIFPLQRHGSWSVNHVEDFLADATFSPERTGDARTGAAEREVGSAYATAWAAYAKQTEWSKSVGYRRVSSHGLRRGVATLQARNGGSLFDVASVLRHGEAMSATCRYIDPHHNDYQAVVQLLAPDAEPAPVPSSFAPDPDSIVDECDDAYDGHLPVLDWGSGCLICGAKRQDLWSAVVDDEPVVLCGYHLAAYSRGKENWRDPRPCEVWGVVDGANGVKHTCDQPYQQHFTDDAGAEIPCCVSHYDRLWKARRRNEELTLDPVVGFGWIGRSTRDATCGVWGVVDGVKDTCDLPARRQITLDDGTQLPACCKHRHRFKRLEELSFDPVVGFGWNGRSIGSSAKNPAPAKKPAKKKSTQKPAKKKTAKKVCGVWGVVDDVTGMKHTCDRLFDSHFTLDDGTPMPCCSSHYYRLEGFRERGEELTLDPDVGFGWKGRSIGEATCGVWGVVDGVKHTCDLPARHQVTLDDGKGIPACSKHRHRFKRVEELSLDPEVGFGWNGRPIGMSSSAPTGCGVWGVHDGVKHTCDRPFRMHVTLDDGTPMPCCKTHRDRLHNARNRNEELLLDPEVGLGKNGRRVGQYRRRS